MEVLQLNAKLVNRIKRIGNRLETLTTKIEAISDPQKSAQRIEQRNKAKIEAMAANLDLFLDQSTQEQESIKSGSKEGEKEAEIQSLEEL